MAAGDLRIEFWPRYTSATSVRVPYYKRVNDLSGTDTPIIRAELIEARALVYACYAAYAKFGDRHWLELADHYKGVYEALWEESVREDHARHGLPRSAQDHRPITAGYDFFVTHDLGE